MANLSIIDFYYGAVLSHLLTDNKEHKPCLIEDDIEKRVFRFTTDNHEYVLRTHKCEGKRDTKKDATSWTFSLTNNEIRALQATHKSAIRNVIALVMVDALNLSNSKIIYFTDNHLKAKGIYDNDKKNISFTVRKYPHKNDYLLFINKREEDAIPVKQNLRLDY